MKNIVHTLFLSTLCILISHTTIKPSESLVGQKAPHFKAQAVTVDKISDISLADYSGKYKILVFYPADFSFVCPTELRALQDKKAEFDQKNAVILGISVDQVYSHQAWLELAPDKGGVKGLTYPLISDIKKEISVAYGVLDQSGISQRGTIIIDDKDTVQSVMINNLSVGRNVDEILRILDAIQFHQEHGDVCPVNWAKGKKSITPTQEGLKEFLHEETQETDTITNQTNKEPL